MDSIVVIRGAGDLASGVALRLQRSGFPIVMLEQERPLVVRRRVAFAEAVFSGKIDIEGVQSIAVDQWGAAKRATESGKIPVMIDPDFTLASQVKPYVLIDARMLKKNVSSRMADSTLLIGIGPGFTVGQNCHVVIETQRGHHLGRVLWAGRAAADTGIPGSIAKYEQDRVLRAPASGTLSAFFEIGQRVKAGQSIAEVNGEPVIAAFDGVLRGLIHSSVAISAGMKIGDLDLRNDPSYVDQVSDKALAIGGGVLEAILSKPILRRSSFGD